MTARHEARDLVRALRESQAPAGIPLRLAQGVVQAVGSGTLEITVGGSDQSIHDVRYFDSYSPTVNDTVFILVNGTDYIVLGKLA